ncbi:NADH-quinone oxidoreductase subunit L [Selenomonas timonae]|uniref:NADH-quinone oxidoreductase subunit L n=1 Tax=Selenomonas timonae TaxID=2754044 RepID=A0A7G7VJR1_9FIRM|nr:NADH-quinone oxidoreductase subunit L [Selenomonas timonae]QNH54354.1 NADH-quinone oxidoreductase subunit L [Selenomonas timonae]
MFTFALTHAYLIPLFPALAFLIIGPFTRQEKNLSATIAITMMSLAFAFSVFVALATVNYQITMNDPYVMKALWAQIGDVKLTMGVLIDPLAAMMLVIVTLVSLLVYIYSVSYMEHDEGMGRFFAFISLFSAAMLGLVVSVNFLQLYVFWEGVGLCSYLLIGFYYHKVSAREAAKKAFITTRIGDFGMLVGILLVQMVFGTMDFIELRMLVPPYVLAAGTGFLTVIGLLLFMGAIGKSGQFPLHVWLLDAMEGPTPTSALIHAATMVAAGVYLVARAFFIFSESPFVMDFIAGLGAFTALFAAIIAVTQRKFKSVLAYSTISQLGYMMLAVGVGAFSASMFHLMTHAFFKAMLFLCAGAVMHALHDETDITKMGGLWKKMPLTFAAMLVGVLAIAGIPPFSGFFSKDEILAAVMHASTPLYVMATVTSFLTAFYMARLLILAFLGESRSKYEAHEVDAFMRWPMIMLIMLTLVSGALGYFGGFSVWVNEGVPHHETIDWTVAGTSTVLALIAFAAAYQIYGRHSLRTAMQQRSYGFLYRVVYNKFYIDELYGYFRERLVYGTALILKWVDEKIFDNIMIGLGAYALATSDLLTESANGQAQRYVVVFYTGVLILLCYALYWAIQIIAYWGGGFR